ncbi:DUF3387 domain-containing protein [Micrococcus luteus]|nr:DUF3387 domain-containing protein [Micrococcus luteus]
MRSGHRDDSIRGFCGRLTRRITRWPRPRLRRHARPPGATPLCGTQLRGRRFTPPLHDDELMFYDVVAQNEAALDVMGDDVLAQIARDLVATMRRDIKTDWTVREDVKAKLRASIKRLLRKYGYPPDQQPEAIVEVMRQMEAVAPRMAEGQ